MKSNSFLKNRKALTALLLCTGFVATQPFSVMAEDCNCRTNCPATETIRIRYD